jgi:hypothetical protein
MSNGGPQRGLRLRAVRPGVVADSRSAEADPEADQLVAEAAAEEEAGAAREEEAGAAREEEAAAAE